MYQKIVKLFLRISLSAAFLSAVADRFGVWPAAISAWGNWEAFLAYTQSLNPWVPSNLIPSLGGLVTGLEVLLGIFLFFGFKTSWSAKISGLLLLLFALAMTLSGGIKGALDYSVFSAAAAAFGLSLMHERYLEVDSLLE